MCTLNDAIDDILVITFLLAVGRFPTILHFQQLNSSFSALTYYRLDKRLRWIVFHYANQMYRLSFFLSTFFMLFSTSEMTVLCWLFSSRRFLLIISVETTEREREREFWEERDVITRGVSLPKTVKVWVERCGIHAYWKQSWKFILYHTVRKRCRKKFVLFPLIYGSDNFFSRFSIRSLIFGCALLFVTAVLVVFAECLPWR